MVFKPLRFEPLTLDKRDASTSKPRLGKPQGEPIQLEVAFAKLVDAEFDRLARVALRFVRGLTTTDAARDDDLRRELNSELALGNREVESLVGAVNAHSAKQVERSVGIYVADITPAKLRPIVRQTTANIRGITTNVSKSLQATIAEASAGGLRGDALVDIIEQRLKVQRDKAKRIAVGQVLQVNSALTRERHQKLGIVEYIWHAVGGKSGDGHTRAWHRKLHGTKCRYDSPPKGGGGGPHDHGHPGTADTCRCQALPVIPPPVAKRATPMSLLKPEDLAERVNELGGVAKAKYEKAGVFANADRANAVLAAFKDVTATQATAIATGEADVAASTQYSKLVSRGATRLPPIELTVLEPLSGRTEVKVTDGRHRSRAAAEAGASAILANITYERETRPGRWSKRVAKNQVVKL